MQNNSFPGKVHTWTAKIGVWGHEITKAFFVWNFKANTFFFQDHNDIHRVQVGQL